jgi:hypothetical protein
MRLRYQLAITMSLLALAVSATMGVLSYTATRNEAIDAVDDFLDRRVGRFGEPGSSGLAVVPGLDGDAAGAGQVASQVASQVEGQVEGRRSGAPVVDDDSIVTVIGADGSLLLTSNPGVRLPLPTVATADPELTTVIIDGERYRLRSEVIADGLTILNARSLAETEATLAAVGERLSMIGIITTMLGAALGWRRAASLGRCVVCRARHIRSLQPEISTRNSTQPRVARWAKLRAASSRCSTHCGDPVTNSSS